VSAQKNNKNAPAGETASPRQPRKKDKMIRLDDLIPKKSVLGGRQLLFGASEPTQNTNPKQQN
jgi:hypothetical protein